MIRAVFDTNVIVSALLQSLGPSSQLLLRCFDGSIQLCVSGSVYAEYEEVLKRPRLARDPEIIAGTLQTIRETGFWVRPIKQVRICSDPDDDMFLECAQAAQAVYLATGNIKHFPPSWGGCRIVTPRRLLDTLLADKPESAS
jgi:putative PIN family toxin of toxin-antitoxin system